MKSMKQDQYTSVGKKGQQRLEANGRNTEDYNFSWLVRSVLRWTPHNELYEKLNLKSYTFTMDAAVQEKRQQVLAERNKALPAQSGKKSGRDQIIMMSKS